MIPSQQAHRNKAEMDTGELKCQLCSKSFKTLRGLKQHESRRTCETERQVRHCPACKRTYLTESGLKKHMDSTGHVAVDLPVNTSTVEGVSGPQVQDPGEDVNEEENASTDVPDEDEIFNAISEADKVISYFIEEEEEEDFLRSLAIGEQASNTQEVPSKKTKKKPNIDCKLCPKKFLSIENYVKHRATHAMSDLTKKAPDEVMIKQKARDLVNSTLQEMSLSQYTAGKSKEVIATVKFVQDKQDTQEWLVTEDRIVSGLTKFFKTTKKFLTPSELRSAFLRSSAVYCADKTERAELNALLVKLIDTSNDVAFLFFGFLLRGLSSHLLAYFIHFLIHDGEDIGSAVPLSARFAVSSQATESIDFKQLMHYVGGANVCSVMRSAVRIKDPNSEWIRIMSTIRKNFLVGEFADAPDEVFSQWTEDQDRGGLLKISKDLHNFFIELGCVVNVMEHFDGSLFVDEVIEKVVSCGKLIRMWDMVVKDSLPQEEAFKLLHALCSHFCCTWRRGIITRRLDEMSSQGVSVGSSKHGMSGVAFRATLT